MTRPTLPDDGIMRAIDRYEEIDREPVRRQQLRMCASTVKHGGDDADFLVSQLLAGGWLESPVDALRWISSLRTND